MHGQAGAPVLARLHTSMAGLAAAGWEEQATACSALVGQTLDLTGAPAGDSCSA